MRSLIWIIIAVVVLGGAFLLATGGMPPGEEAAPDAAPEAAPAPAPTEDSSLNETAPAEVEEGPVEVTEEETAPAAEPVTETVEDTASAVTEALEEAAAAIGTEEGMAALLDADTIDFDAVSQAVQESELGIGVKAALTAAIEQARTDPALLDSVLEQLREQFGN